MDREFLSNNYQEGMFEPDENKEEKSVEVKESPTGETTEKKTRYYSSSIAPAIHRTPYAYANVERSTSAENAIQVIYTIGGIVNSLLAIRLLLKLLGANVTGIVSALYRVTEPLVSPFQGILPSSQASHLGFLEVPTVFAIIVVTLVTFAVAALIKSTTENY